MKINIIIQYIIDFHLSPRIHGDQNRARVRVYVALGVSDSERMQNVGLVQVRQRQKVIRRLHRRRVPVAELDLLSQHAHPSVRFSLRLIYATRTSESEVNLPLCTAPGHHPALPGIVRHAPNNFAGPAYTAFTGAQ